MHISWLGTSAIKLQTKPLEEDVTVLIDPYTPTQGNFPKSLAADLVIYTRGTKNGITLQGTPFILSTSGEIEIKGVLVTALATDETGHTIVRLDSEKLSIGHLGLRQSPIKEADLELLAEVDILFIPVGGIAGCYDARSAAQAIQKIEPRVIIPIGYKSDTDPDAKDIAEFMKELGLPKEDAEKKVIIKKKDLTAEDMRCIVVSKE